MRRSRAKGVSDLVLASEDRPYARIAGEWRPAMEGRVRLPDLGALLERLTRNEAATALVLGGVEMDFGCEAAGRSGEAISRFRGNASAVANGWTPGLSLTLRLLPDLPPPLESLELDPGLSRALLPDNGLVLVTGVMGSGKSTLLAAVLRRLLETTRRHVATYESPIEFDLANLPGRLAPVGQSEIGRHLPAFGLASRNAARRAADVVLIGEARDRETLRSALEAAEIGVAVYATVHTRGVAATPGRIISAFARGERPQIASALLSALRVVIQQRLYPKVGGGRLAVREWLVLDRGIRDDLQSLPLERVRERLETLVAERGRSLAASARVETERGRLAPEILHKILKEKGGPVV
jgi:defect-in-organelle-trafficking protein DotB